MPNIKALIKTGISQPVSITGRGKKNWQLNQRVVSVVKASTFDRSAKQFENIQLPSQIHIKVES